MRTEPVVGLALLALASLTTGCGGGGGDAPPPLTITLVSIAPLEGTVDAGGGIIQGGWIVGDLGGTNGYRGFVSFDLGPLPAGATIVSATLRLVQRSVAGSPYATLGSLVVDQVVYGNVLDAGAYARAFPTNQGFGTLSADATLGPKSLVVTAQVEVDRAVGRAQSQFRLRFETEANGDGVSDYADFATTSVATAAADQPVLILTYQP
jgi:hypothetical protein